MDWERQLVSRVARDQGIEKLISLGIEDKHFDLALDGSPGQGQRIYGFMMSHLRQYHQAPSFEVVVHEFPDYDFLDPTDSFDYIVAQFLNVVKRREAERMLVRVATQLAAPNSDKYIEDIEGHILSEARDLAYLLPKTTSSRFSDMKKRVEIYGHQNYFGIEPGIPYPFPRLNNWMHGIQPHEVVTISGWSGLGKSYLGLLMCYHAYLAGFTPLIISLEMGADAINRRLDIMATHFSHRAMRKIELEDEQIELWKVIAEKVETGRKEHDIIIKDDLNFCTADRVYAETVKYKPDIVMIDYISLMDSPRGFKGAHWEKITEISRRLKGQARGLNIPILSIAQTNRSSAKEGAKDDNLAYANAILQDSDVLFGLHADDEMKGNKKMMLSLNKNREGERADFELFWDVDNGIFREWNLSDMMRNTREDPANAL